MGLPVNNFQILSGKLFDWIAAYQKLLFDLLLAINSILFRRQSMSGKKWVYRFDEVEQAEKYVGGNWDGVRALLGGKGANLAEMTRIGVPVPPGFTVTTEACNAYLAEGNKFPEGLWTQELEALKAVEVQT